MTPATARKAGRTYGDYVSAALHQGRRDEAGTVPRVAARAIESAMVLALRERCPHAESLSDGDLVGRHLTRARLTGTTIEMDVVLRPHGPTEGHSGDDAGSDDDDREPVRVSIPWTSGPTRRARAIILPKASTRQAIQPIHAATRSTVVRSVAQGRHWLAEITQGTVTGPDAIASREGCSPRRVAMMISLAFLAPDLVQAAIDGRLLRGIGVSRLFDAPTEWTRQHAMLGL